MSLAVAVLDKSGVNAVPKIIEALKTCIKTSNFGVASASEFAVTKKVELLAKKVASPAVLAFATSKSNKKPAVIKAEEKTAIFEGVAYAPKSTSILEMMRKDLGDDTVDAAKATIETVEGDYSLLIAEANRIVAARDPLGMEPLYYGENSQVAALSSNRKTLWLLGIESPTSFPPGNLAVVNREGFQFQAVKVLNYSKSIPITLDDAVKKLQELLEQSVRLRVGGVRKVAVAFSGGLDSSIVAFLAKKCGVEVQLIHVSLENQHETEEAWKAAEELDLPLRVHLFKEADVERVIYEVVALIEEPDALKASIGIPFYWAAEKAAESGYRVLLAGQGADELFGGYQRYVNEYLMRGEENVRRTMYRDIVGAHESNIERDKKICRFHDVELRLPFASYQIAEFALRLPIELKFEKSTDSSRKVVLRKTAESLGLSGEIFGKPKKAIQYGTGVTDALKRIAKRKRKTLAEYIGGLFLKC